MVVRARQQLPEYFTRRRKLCTVADSSLSAFDTLKSVSHPRLLPRPSCVLRQMFVMQELPGVDRPFPIVALTQIHTGWATVTQPLTAVET